MSDDPLAFDVALGFTSKSAAIADPDRPGLLRAGERTSTPYENNAVDVHRCDITDLCRDASAQPDLFDVGFDLVSLASMSELQDVFARVADAGSITGADGAAIKAALNGSTLHCANGRALEVVYVAEEGLIMRTSGPNGLRESNTGPKGMNGHGAATSVHADQDVYGTPLRQLMGGKAPTLLRHDSPDGSNHDASLMLVNLWVPLHQITQPLVLADGRSIDRRRHQLRYGLPTSSFLERDDEMVINDIWTFLHDPDQKWYFRSDMDHRNGWVFNTLSTPHGAGTLPGEDVAEQCSLGLIDGEEAVRTQDRARLGTAMAPLRDVTVPATTAALAAAVSTMIDLAIQATDNAFELCGDGATEWLRASTAARRRVTRTSLELRMVVSVTP